MVKRVAKCRICRRVVDSDLILLVDSSEIHEKCFQRLIDRPETNRAKVRRHLAEIEDTEWAKKKEDGFFKLLFGGAEQQDKVNELHRKINELKGSIKKLETKVEKDEKTLAGLYDFWPERPPDWELRATNRRADSSNACEACGETEVPLHVHHIISIDSGGDHRPANLEVLCFDCHEREHPWLDDETTTKGGGKRLSFHKKMKLVRDALKNDRRLRFKYRNYDGEETHRTILPESIMKPGEMGGDIELKNLCLRGYCDLREDYRHFAIKKMREIKII